MIGKLIMALLQFLDDTFKHIRCYSRCCQVNECSCSNTDISIEDETPHHRQTTEDSQISRRSHHSHHSSDKDDLEKAL